MNTHVHFQHEQGRVAIAISQPVPSNRVGKSGLSPRARGPIRVQPGGSVTRPSYLQHEKLSAYDRETIALAAIAIGSLVGIGLIWWLG